jgi:hypothetical protein
VSLWFNVWRNALDNFEEKLTLDDVMTEDKASQVRAKVECSRVIDESKSFSKQHRRG